MHVIAANRAVLYVFQFNHVELPPHWLATLQENHNSRMDQHYARESEK